MFFSQISRVWVLSAVFLTGTAQPRYLRCVSAWLCSTTGLPWLLKAGVGVPYIQPAGCEEAVSGNTKHHKVVSCIHQGNIFWGCVVGKGGFFFPHTENNFPVFQPLNCHQNTLKCNDSIHLLASVLFCARSPFGGAAGTFSLLGNFRRESQQIADRACKKGSWLCLLSSSAVAAFTSLKNMMYLVLFSGLL